MAQLLWPGNQIQIRLLSWPFWRATFSSPNSPASTAAGGPTLNKIMVVLSISHSSVIWANNYRLLLTLKYQLHTISSTGLVWRLAKQSSKSTNRRNTFQPYLYFLLNWEYHSKQTKPFETMATAHFMCPPKKSTVFESAPTWFQIHYQYWVGNKLEPTLVYRLMWSWYQRTDQNGMIFGNTGPVPA